MNYNANELPLGLTSALARNMSAMERFSMMSDVQRDAVVAGARKVENKQDMKALINGIADGVIPGVY